MNLLSCIHRSHWALSVAADAGKRATVVNSSISRGAFSIEPVAPVLFLILLTLLIRHLMPQHEMRQVMGHDGEYHVPGCLFQSRAEREYLGVRGDTTEVILPRSDGSEKRHYLPTSASIRDKP